jgi:hypothetical protein
MSRPRGTEDEAEVAEGGVVGYARRIRWATVLIRTDWGTYLGRVQVPHGLRRVEDVLNDARAFVTLFDATMTETGEVQPLLALNKRCVRTARILDPSETGGRFDARG